MAETQLPKGSNPKIEDILKNDNIEREDFKEGKEDVENEDNIKKKK